MGEVHLEHVVGRERSHTWWMSMTYEHAGAGQDAPAAGCSSALALTSVSWILKEQRGGRVVTGESVRGTGYRKEEEIPPRVFVSTHEHVSLHPQVIGLVGSRLLVTIRQDVSLASGRAGGSRSQPCRFLDGRGYAGRLR